jgi:hypothetical protein
MQEYVYWRFIWIRHTNGLTMNDILPTYLHYFLTREKYQGKSLLRLIRRESPVSSIYDLFRNNFISIFLSIGGKPFIRCERVNIASWIKPTRVIFPNPTGILFYNRLVCLSRVCIDHVYACIQKIHAKSKMTGAIQNIRMRTAKYQIFTHARCSCGESWPPIFVKTR